MFRINVSENKSNYSQRKTQFVHIQKGQYGENKIDWTCTCNVHSLVMAAIYAGWVFPQSDYSREPDSLANYIVNKCIEPNNWYKEKMPKLWENWYEGDPRAYSPLEVHAVLTHYFNEYIGVTNADKFLENASIKDIINQIYKNGIGVPTSVKWANLVGHIICLVGFECESETKLNKWLNSEIEKCPITKIIFDDPWGKYVESVDSYDGTKSGNDCEISFETFLNYVKPNNSKSFKYAHILNKPASFV